MPAQLIENLHMLEHGRHNPGGTLTKEPGGEGAPSSVARLVRTHHQLSQIVAPATPRTLLILEEDKEDASAWSFLGPIKIIRRLLARLVETLESLVQGETREVIAQQKVAANMKAAQLVTASRVQMALDLVKVREQLQQGASPQELKAQLGVNLGRAPARRAASTRNLKKNRPD